MRLSSDESWLLTLILAAVGLAGLPRSLRHTNGANREAER